jgi:Flp pilus assembly protein TadG
MKTLRSERGQQFVLVALLLPFLIAFLGLAVDVGNVFVHQRRVQNAADAAAAAGGMVLYPQGRTVAINTATYYATRNGYTDNGTTVRVWVRNPPTSGAYANNAKYIQVEVQEAITPIFAAVIWNGTFTVRGTATAGYKVKALGADLYALKDTTTCDGYTSMTMNGNPGKIRAINGIVQVNSPCNNAVSVGNGDIEASVINIHGPITAVNRTVSSRRRRSSMRRKSRIRWRICRRPARPAASSGPALWVANICPAAMPATSKTPWTSTCNSTAAGASATACSISRDL